MPVRKTGPPQSGSYPELRDLLVNEIKSPKGEDAATPNDPFIIEETVAHGPLIHVLIIWNRWKDVPLDHRGGVILEAYDMGHGPGTAQNVTVAMGVTYDEARRLKIGPPDILERAS